MESNPHIYPHINIIEIDTKCKPTYGLFTNRTQAKVGELFYHPKFGSYAFNSWGGYLHANDLLFISKFMERLNEKFKK